MLADLEAATLNLKPKTSTLDTKHPADVEEKQCRKQTPHTLDP